jgi:hypothetical protein
MRVFAYCGKAFEDATRRAAGVVPVTCPPMEDAGHPLDAAPRSEAARFDPAWLEGQDFIYFDLHGAPGRAYWYGDDGMIALTARTIRSAHLDGTVVFTASCYLGDESSPMLDALLAAGARCVIGGIGQNWGPGRGPLYGAPLLGLWVRRLVGIGLEPGRALAVAKVRMRLGRFAEAAAAWDARAFRMYVRKT